MTTQYTSILKLALPVQGELSGTWGDTVNDNITSMVEEAIAGRSVINSWTANSHTLTTANGTTSESRCAMLEFTDTGAALSGNATVICPTAPKIYIAKNAVGSSRTVTLKTSAGTGIAIPDGTTMFLFCDGTNVVEAVTNMNSFTVGGTVTIVAIKDEDDMASDSATALATQQSIKAYVDSQIAATNELSEVLAAGNTSGGTAIQMTTTDEVQFRDTALKISSSADGQLDIDADVELEITAPTVDIDASTAVLVSNDLKLDSDDAVLGFGADNDVTLTHIPDTALQVNDAIAVQFRDAALSINSSADGQLDIDADTEIEITAPTVDIDASTEVNISGATKIGGTLSVDAISEYTATAGVDIDGILLKDTSVGTDPASGTDQTGTAVTIKGGAGTGTGAGGSLVFQTAPAGTTGSSANAQVTALTIDSAGDATFTGASYNMSWDKSADSLIFADNAKAVFGAGSDLQIYHDGTYNFINAASGQFIFMQADELRLRSSTSETYFAATLNGATTLYHDASAKLSTTSTGVDVTGVITTDGMTTSADINFGDNDKAVFGSATDLSIYSDGSNSYIQEGSGTSGIRITTDNSVAIRKHDDENIAVFNVDGAVRLYHDNVERIATTSTGIDVTGTIVGDGLTIDGDPALNGNVTITSTASGALAGPYLTLDRNSSSPADSDLIGILSFRGRDDGANVADYGTIAGKIADVTDTTEDGVMLFTVLSGGSSRDVLTLSHNESVFNNGGADQDFRIESDNNANMLYLDAGNDRVGIGSTPNTTFHVIGPNQSGYGTMTIEGNADEVDPRLSFYGYSTTAGTTRAYTLDIYSDVSEKGARYDVPSGYYQAWTIAGSKKMSLASNGYLGINELSPDFHLHVNSGTTNVVAKFESTDSTSVIQFVDSGGNSEFGTSGSTARISPNGSYAVLEASQTAVVLNNAAQDTDFRVESVNQTHMLFVDGGNDSVNIGASDGSVAALQVNGEVNSTILRLTSGSSYQGLRFNGETTFGNGTVQILPVTIPGSGTANQYTYFNKITSGGTTNHHVVVENSFSVQDGEAVFNQDGNDNDFRVESDGATHMLFVDAGNNQVAVGTSSLSDSGFMFGVQGSVTIGDRANSVAGVYNSLELSGYPLNDTIADYGSYGALRFYANTTYTSGARRVLLTNAYKSNQFGFLIGDTDPTSEPNVIIQGNATNALVPLAFENTGTVVVNQESAAGVDFRVESDSNSNMIFVDAGNDRVGIAHGAPNETLSVRNDSAADILSINGASASTETNIANILFRNLNSASTGSLVKLGVDTGSAGDRGDLVISTSPASNTPTERIRVTQEGHTIIPGGVTLGTSAGTYAAANTLDDYEEGTWTPTNAGATLTVTNARYTKIGRLVNVSCHVVANADTSGDWGGLPFTMDVNGMYSGSVGYQNDTTGETWNVIADVGTSWTMRKGLTSEQITSGNNMRMSLTYCTTA